MASSSSEEQKLIALTKIAAGVLSVDAASISIEQRIPLEIQSNRLYSATDGIRCIILKEFLKPDELEAAPLREYRALELLSNLDIAPQPRAFIPQHQDHNPLVIYDYMEGQMWDRRAPSRNDLKRLAELWIQINEVKSSSLWLSRSQERSKHEIWDGVQAVFDSYLQWTSSHCIQALHTALLAKELAEQRSNIIDDLSGLEVPLCFCRSDPRFANVISRPDGRLGLVDWEDSGLHDPALDLADLFEHPNQEDLLGPDDRRAFLEPYLRKRMPVDEGLQHRFNLYRGLLSVWWLSILISAGLDRFETGSLDQWRIHGTPPNEKLSRYLSRALAYPEVDSADLTLDAARYHFFPA